MELSQSALEAIWRFFGLLGLVMLSIASDIEPKAAVWVSAAGAAFVSMAIGKDRTIPKMVLHIVVGTIIGICAAATLAWIWGTPRAPVALFFGLFGFDIAAWIRDQVQKGTFLETIASAAGTAIAKWRGR